MSNYSPEQKTEIEKLLKYIEQMEGIVRTSPSREQVERVRKQINTYTSRLLTLMPHLDRNRLIIKDIRAELGGPEETDMDTPAPPASGGSTTAPPRRPVASAASQLDILARYPVERASAHSTDNDVNFLATILRVIQREYIPVISDRHCKMDYSHASERDALRNHLETAFRNLKVLAETIEEYATAENQDFREQLLKMKNKQTRIFLFESNQSLKKVREFLRKLVGDLNGSGHIIMNPENTIHFDSRYEEATGLEGAPLPQGIREFETFVTQAIEKLNLPELKIKAPGGERNP